MQAHDIAARAGAKSIAEITSGHDSIAKLPNVLEEFLAPGATATEERKRRASIAVQKASLTTFQVWMSKASQLTGILLAEFFRKRWTCRRLVVGTTVDALLASNKIKQVGEKEGLKPVGVVLPGDAMDEGVLALVRQALEQIRDQGAESAIGVIVPRNRHSKLPFLCRRVVTCPLWCV